MKKIISLVLLVIITLSLIGCTNAEYSEIINTAENGKNPPELNIRYDPDSKTLSWNKVDGVAAYVVQIGDYSQTINNNSVSFRENIENGIYTVTITPRGYKSVTTVFTVGIQPQNSYIETIILIISASILTILLIISIIIIIKLKRNKSLQDKKINFLSEKEMSKKVNELTQEKKEYEKKLLYSENALQEALNKKLKSEQKLEEATKNLSIVTTEKIDFETKYLKTKNSLEKSEETHKKAEEEILKEQADLKEKLQKVEEELKIAKNKAETSQKELSEAILQIANLKATPPKIQEKIVYKTSDNSKESNKFSTKKSKDYRKLHEANICCSDGHYVRSKAEQIIDDFFYYNKIIHAYEKLFIDPKTNQKYYADFYLPEQKLYIEYFGLDTDEYKQKRERKIEAYKNNPNIKFEFLDHGDDDTMKDKLQSICEKHNIPITF